MSTDDPNVTTTAPAAHKMSRADEPARGEALPWTSLRAWPFRVLLIVLAVGGIVGWIYWNSADGPREADRVRHPVGYSIVKPRGWIEKIQTKPSESARDALNLEPDKWLGLAPTMYVKRLLWPPDQKKLLETGYVTGDFQGRQALLSQQKKPKRIIRTAILQVGGDWYELGVNLPGLEGARVDDCWAYPLTFQPAPPSSSATQATTQPATAPSAPGAGGT
jgi:hypothetical protein